MSAATPPFSSQPSNSYRALAGFTLKIPTVLFLASFLSIIASCGNDELGTPLSQTPTGSQNSKKLFDLDRVLYIDVQLSPGDWSALSQESKYGFGAWRTVNEDPNVACFEYTYFYGDFNIDGEQFTNVAVRKKGAIGSADQNRPSLKVNLENGEGNDNRRYEGEKRFTLNNNKQDQTNIKQCLSYSIFADAGIYAPRCNFAQIRAQGRELGVYTHVEAIKKPFLKRAFGDKSGNLYETQRDGAFIESRVALFQAKTNENNTDRQELQAVVDAMAMDDEQMLLALERVINVDYFIRFVAMEALLGHIDGLTGYQNNVYIYQNPSDSLLYFIPWGTDQSFRRNNFSDPQNVSPVTIQLGSELTLRLWESESFRVRYDAVIRELLATVWNEPDFHDRADKMAALVGVSSTEIEEIHLFIDERRSRAEAELKGEEDRLGSWSYLPPVLEEAEECSAEPSVASGFIPLETAVTNQQ